MNQNSTITDLQAKYFAHLLTRKFPADDKEKFISTILDAQVEPKPHQIEAALFAFRSPFATGAILADEVGLGKTIEAGLVIAQKWAEGCRNILIICPASLRQQWNQELREKFFLDSEIIDGKRYNELTKQNSLISPFNQNLISIVSYQFASNKNKDIENINWDLVVIDEAHRLRNVYKKANKTAQLLKKSLENAPKLLLTATPLQNSLLELYGLASFIDNKAFGDAKSFKEQYVTDGEDASLADLRNRIQRFTFRTLRNQVLEYINYTNRIPEIQTYKPTKEESELYDQVTEYLQREELYALPNAQRHLMTLIMRKLLASSSFAISQTLIKLAERLEGQVKGSLKMAKAVSFEGVFTELDLVDELIEALPIGPVVDKIETKVIDLTLLNSEIKDLRKMADLALSIRHNNKADALTIGLETCFNHLDRLEANNKAIIFTEFTRTQQYLFEYLSQIGYEGKIVLFNGSNTDQASTKIYQDWIKENEGTDRITGSTSANRKAAIVDYFKNHAQIMIATEAAAEGMNLQFCSLVVNYDLPWNPQRVEQRIGRCHRYGQKHDVVVLNFLNEENAADKRVYELLSEKFKLFEGMFGVSDQVLGALESGIDIQTRIADIYQRCRTPEDIQIQFDDLQAELELEIESKMDVARQNLLENFDKDVHEVLKISLDQSNEYLNKHEKWLWLATKYKLSPYCKFDDRNHSFEFTQPFFDLEVGDRFQINPAAHSHKYRIHSPLAQHVLDDLASLITPHSSCTIDFSESTERISILEELVGKNGLIDVSVLSLKGAAEENYIITSGICNSQPISPEQCSRLLELQHLDCTKLDLIDPSDKKLLDNQITQNIKKIQVDVSERNSEYFDDELTKIESWADDKKLSLEISIKALDKEIKTRRTESRKLSDLTSKVAEQRAIKALEQKRNTLRRELFDKQDEIDREKDYLLDNIQAKLESESIITSLFILKWNLI